jgi:hypothetical protein
MDRSGEVYAAADVHARLDGPRTSLPALVQEAGSRLALNYRNMLR